MRTTIEMAREASGDDWGLFQEYMPEIHRLAELVRADERARMATDKSKEVLKLALEKIANVNAMDYEYQAWAREALAEQPAPVQGWRMVPVQPTDEMRDVGNVIIKDRGALFAAYRAMLDAAPQPAQQQTMYLESGGAGYGPAPERKLIIGYVNKPEQPAQQEPVEKDNSNYRLDPPGLDPLHQELKTAEAVGYSIGFGAGYQAGKNASPPAQRTWVGLTDDEIAEQDWHLSADRTYEQWTLQEQLVVCGVKDFARAIEAKLREKNS